MKDTRNLIRVSAWELEPFDGLTVKYVVKTSKKIKSVFLDDKEIPLKEAKKNTKGGIVRYYAFCGILRIWTKDYQGDLYIY